MKVGYAILAHDHPENVAALARHLIDGGGLVAVHLDRKAGEASKEAIVRSLGSQASEVIWAERVSVGWGEWSMIEATINAVNVILRSGVKTDFIHLMSGADYPIRPLQEFVQFLERHPDTEFIESHSANFRKWVVDGLTKERYQYRHFFNYKKHRKLFIANWKIQRALGLRRKLPRGMTLHMGSQWCTLTTPTWTKLLELSRRRDVLKMFRTSWIPDEMFFQTLLATLDVRHSNRNLTHYQFTDYGVPVVYCNGHTGQLLRQPFFFARKISAHARELRQDLDRVIRGELKPVSFHDHQIGAPTRDYELFQARVRRQSVGKRIPGMVKDAWYGDLEWNPNPYVLIRGASWEELDCISSELDRLPGIVGHGRLFAKDQIYFAGGRKRLAGYGRNDTTLRDHKPANFLSDVMNAVPGRLCTFGLTWDENQLLGDIAAFDRKCAVVLVKGNPLRALAEEVSELSLSADELRLDAASAHDRIVASSEAQSEAYDKYVLKLRRARARYIEIDLYSRNWRSELSGFLEEFATPDTGSASVAWRTFANTTNVPHLSDLSRKLPAAMAWSRSLPGPLTRSRQMVSFLSAMPDPYLVLTGSSSAELSLVSSRLAQLDNFILRDHLHGTDDAGTPAGAKAEAAEQKLKHVDSGLEVLLSTSGLRGSRVPVFVLDQVKHADTIECAIHDEKARIVYLSGSPLGRVAGAGQPVEPSLPQHLPSLDPQRLEHLFSRHQEALLFWQSAANEANAIVEVIDTKTVDWIPRLCAFMQGLSDEPAEEWATRLLELLKNDNLKIQTLGDPASTYSNAEYIRMRLRTLDQGSEQRANRIVATARMAEHLKQQRHERYRAAEPRTEEKKPDAT